MGSRRLSQRAVDGTGIRRERRRGDFPRAVEGTGIRGERRRGASRDAGDDAWRDAFRCLARHDVAAACEVLAEAGYTRGAAALAARDAPSTQPALDAEFSRANAAAAAAPGAAAAFEARALGTAAGRFDLEDDLETAKPGGPAGLHWRTRLGLHAWYGRGSFADAVAAFDDAVSLGRARPPRPGKRRGEGAVSAQYALLKAATSTRGDAAACLDAFGHGEVCGGALHAWHLALTLRSIGACAVDDEMVRKLGADVIERLCAGGAWHWALFAIAATFDDAETRAALARDLLCRHARGADASDASFGVLKPGANAQAAEAEKAYARPRRHLLLRANPIPHTDYPRRGRGRDPAAAEGLHRGAADATPAPRKASTAAPRRTSTAAPPTRPRRRGRPPPPRRGDPAAPEDLRRAAAAYPAATEGLRRGTAATRRRGRAEKRLRRYELRRAFCAAGLGCPESWLELALATRAGLTGPSAAHCGHLVGAGAWLRAERALRRRGPAALLAGRPAALRDPLEAVEAALAEDEAGAEVWRGGAGLFLDYARFRDGLAEAMVALDSGEVDAARLAALGEAARTLRARVDGADALKPDDALVARGGDVVDAKVLVASKRHLETELEAAARALADAARDAGLAGARAKAPDPVDDVAAATPHANSKVDACVELADALVGGA